MNWSEESRTIGVRDSEVASAWILAGVFILGLLTWSLKHDASYNSSETTASIDTIADPFERAPTLLNASSAYPNESKAQMPSVY